jgi:hypothetical protein
MRELAASGLLVLADKGYAGVSARLRTRTRTGKAHRAEGRQPRFTPSCPAPANAPTPSSKPGASCANSAAAPRKAGQLAKAIHVLQTREIGG